jgi:GTPase SAR1 family protein
MYLSTPFTCLVVGPTRSGKSHFCRQLVENVSQLLQPPPTGGIIWCYKEWQPTYENLRGVDFHEGLPDIESLKSVGKESRLLILDDFMTDLSNDDRLVQLFTIGAHHWNLSIIHITQSVFLEKCEQPG